MQRADHIRLIEDLRHALRVAPEKRCVARPAFRVPSERYTSDGHANREREMLFGQMRQGRWVGPPRVIAASSQVAVGQCVPIDTAGTSVILTRDASGELRALANACRHRGSRLVNSACAAKAMTCPYHGWTYDLKGTLMHVPHGDSFTPEDRRDMISLPVSERHGMIWLGSDIQRHLGGLDADFTSMGLDGTVLWRTHRQKLKCNWKLICEAFLDGYHFRMLHRDTIYKFFLDATALAEPVDQHVRACTARRGLREAPADLTNHPDLRALGTPSYIVSPGTIVVEHPDFVSIVVLHPTSAGETDYEHFMMVPANRFAEAEHWNKSWTLIEEVLFQKEDLWACEQVQLGLAAGTTDALLFGELETAVRLFHAVIDARMENTASLASLRAI